MITLTVTRFLVVVSLWHLILAIPMGVVDAFAVHPPFARIQSTTGTFPVNSMSLLSSAHSSDVVDRLDLTASFGRWRFLQRLLDEDAKNTDVNQVLYAVLVGFLERPRRKEEVPNEMVSPILNDFNRNIIEGVLVVNAESVDLFGDDSTINEHVLGELERLLPDPVENGDAHKGAWDTVCEIHGRGSVQVNEGKARKSWKAVSSIARLLIYYDFLTPDWYEYKRKAIQAS